MRSLKQRFSIAVATAFSGGLLFAGPGTGCISFALESGLESLDFCFIFDCQQGVLGGTGDLCTEAPSGTDTGGFEAVFSPPIGPTFVDCPNFTRP
jgi:hypothetical protein